MAAILDASDHEVFETYSNTLKLVWLFTADNLQEVTFTHNGETSGKYTDLKSDGFTYIQNTDTDGKEDGTYTVTIRLRTKTEIEKRLDALETGQVTLQQGHESNAGAIEDLAGMIGGEE